ncbi:MAG: DNA polymerase/3'-5' exonuclease PolX [Candidatus Kapaibacterium sp.]
MDTREIERVLSRIEALLDLHGENSFKSRAYGRAARAIRSAGVDLADVILKGGEIAIDGVGSGIAAEIREMVETGTSSQLEDLMERTPNGLLDVMSIRGLGSKKVRSLWQELGIESIDDLEEKAKGGEIAALKGFGAKTEANILQGVAELKANVGKMRLHTATTLAAELLPALRELPGVGRVEIAGRLRRGGEEFSTLPFVLESEDVEEVKRGLSDAEILSDIAEKDRTIYGTIDGTYKVLIHVASPDEFVVTLHQKSAASDYRFMVSIPLHDRGYELTERSLLKGGESVAVASEEELYQLAGMQYIPPELREGIDEVRVALDGGLPELVTGSDLRGILHVHSTWSDGRNSIEELAEQAEKLGYQYLLMCDHSKAAFYANGLNEARLEAQGKEIDEVNKKYDPNQFRVLKGIECDILADGSLDLADDALAALDCVVVSIHSSFNLPEEVQTERVCRALDNRYATILAHPTGRLILTRKGYPINLKQVIAHAAERGKFVELNANPYRLDLNWRMIRYAKRKGVKVAIDPDAHAAAEFDYHRYGVTIARKGWLTKEDVLNALPLEKFLATVAETRSR